jgi:pyruvate kinase
MVTGSVTITSSVKDSSLGTKHNHIVKLSEEPTDIWFTIGPNSNDPQTVNQILEKGATGVRLTFSFGTPKLQEQFASLVSDASANVSQPCTIVADLPGEKVRLGEFRGLDEIRVGKGENVRLAPPSGTFNAYSNRLPIDSEVFLEQTNVGDVLTIGDGAVILRAIERDGADLICEVVDEGTINQKRGIVVQGGDFEPSALTDDDLRSLRYVASSGAFDTVALSFVSGAAEVKKAKAVLHKEDQDVPIVSKIETRGGVENIDEIAEISDAIMVARGDLALYLPWEELGYHVANVVDQVRKHETPWIMATQVAEGLERFSFPTRAEICDLTRWNTEGMDGVLLSYETAFGSDPEKAVSRVRDIVRDRPSGNRA